MKNELIKSQLKGENSSLKNYREEYLGRVFCKTPTREHI